MSIDQDEDKLTQIFIDKLLINVNKATSPAKLNYDIKVETFVQLQVSTSFNYLNSQILLFLHLSFLFITLLTQILI